MKKSVTYISGGARSGKSSFALTQALLFDKRAYLATAEAFDEEMQKRIKRHQDEREDQFITIEEPVDIADAISKIAGSVDVVLIDCLTVWVNNLMYHRNREGVASPEVEAFLRLLDTPPANLVIVSNELGMGIVPADALSRQFRDFAGFLNQEVAQRATEAHFCVSGIPIQLK